MSLSLGHIQEKICIKDYIHHKNHDCEHAVVPYFRKRKDQETEPIWKGKLNTGKREKIQKSENLLRLRRLSTIEEEKISSHMKHETSIWSFWGSWFRSEHDYMMIRHEFSRMAEMSCWVQISISFASTRWLGEAVARTRENEPLIFFLCFWIISPSFGVFSLISSACFICAIYTIRLKLFESSHTPTHLNI